MILSSTKGTTNYPEIDKILVNITEKIQIILENNLVGVYLFGSLTYGDFIPDRSDIDLIIFLKNQLNSVEIEQVKQLHHQIEAKYPQWHHRIEASYTPINMLGTIFPPNQPRPYYNEGDIWEALYGNEWIINLYLLDKHGITIFGRDIHELVKSIDIADVQQACIRDLYKEWEPKLRQPEWLNNSHYQSYLVLNLCRILNTVINAEAKSKQVSAGWVKTTYPQWKELINTALDWDYSIKMTKQQETLDFLKFVIDEVKHAKSHLLLEYIA